MKICTICKHLKQNSEFSPSKQSLDGLYAHCKTCHNKTMRDRYHTNPKEKLEDCARRRQILMDITDSIKSVRGCYFCKEKDSVCLDFHHINPSIKDSTIARLVTCKSREKMMTEIEKCIVICSNCHRKLHAGKLTIGVIGSTNDSESFRASSNLASSANFVL